jgi:hypothetical protein
MLKGRARKGGRRLESRKSNIDVWNQHARLSLSRG